MKRQKPELKNSPEKAVAKRKSAVREIHSFLLRGVLALSMIYLLFFYVVGVFIAPNQDMFPRIDQGDLLVYYRLAKSPGINEVILFHKNNTTYIGRVLAGPGDRVEINEDQHVVVNGNRIFEPSIFYNTSIYEGFLTYPLTLTGDEYFILADHREGAEDSRYFGPVTQSEIGGTVITVLRKNDL